MVLIAISHHSVTAGDLLINKICQAGSGDIHQMSHFCKLILFHFLFLPVCLGSSEESYAKNLAIQSVKLGFRYFSPLML